MKYRVTLLVDFETEEKASMFIEKLPDYLSGRYGIVN